VFVEQQVHDPFSFRARRAAATGTRREPMSYLVLARKYRPQVFEDVVGQDHVTRTLANAIAAGRVAHAYLFCGPRGVGKTTAARILAKALNCEHGPTAVPCNECTPCLEITGGRSMDVLEIDGASNRGINEVRELRENARYAPSGGRSKVYIIDEVHMLTHEAFNALLKTLEEPPAHVVFVLATTEPFKLPATILSRCQRFDFARIPSREIAGHLAALMEKEGIEASRDALSLVARRAGGGVRDALSLMDQIISAATGAIDRSTVEQILGLVGADFYETLTDRLAAGDAGGALALLDTIYTRGADLGELAEGLAGHLRDLLMLRIDPALASILEASESEVPRLAAQAEAFSREALSELVERAADTTVALRRSPNPRLTMELALAEMAQAASRVPLADLAARLLDLETRLGGEAPPAASDRPSEASASGHPKPKTTPRRRAERSASPPANDPAGIWAGALEALKERNKRIWATCHNAEAVGLAPDGALVLRAAAGGNILADALGEEATRALLAEILGDLGAAVPRVRLEGERGAGASDGADTAAADAAPAGGAGVVEPTPASGGAEEATPASAGAETEGPAEAGGEEAGPAPEPAKPRAKKRADDTRSMGQLFKEEPMLQKALDMFDGEVLP
jgi:DNA polymerase-3 subunit gamma/tau